MIKEKLSKLKNSKLIFEHLYNNLNMSTEEADYLFGNIKLDNYIYKAGLLPCVSDNARNKSIFKLININKEISLCQALLHWKGLKEETLQSLYHKCKYPYTRDTIINQLNNL